MFCRLVLQSVSLSSLAAVSKCAGHVDVDAVGARERLPLPGAHWSEAPDRLVVSARVVPGKQPRASAHPRSRISRNAADEAQYPLDALPVNSLLEISSSKYKRIFYTRHTVVNDYVIREIACVEREMRLKIGERLCTYE